MDWTQIIVAFIAAGGLSAICLISERKSSASIDNALKLSSESLQRTELLAEKYMALANEYQEQAEKATQRAEQKEMELMNQIKINSSLHHKMDNAHTRCAVLELTHCDLALTCPNKKPPLAATARQYLNETDRQNGNDQ